MPLGGWSDADGTTSRLYGTRLLVCRAFAVDVAGRNWPITARDNGRGAPLRRLRTHTRNASARAGPTGVGEVPCLARRHRLIVYGRGASAAQKYLCSLCTMCALLVTPVRWSPRTFCWHLTGLSPPKTSQDFGGRLGKKHESTFVPTEAAVRPPHYYCLLVGRPVGVSAPYFAYPLCTWQ